MTYTSAVKILLIEDNPSFANLIRFLVSEEESCPWTIQHVQTLEDGLACLNKEMFDIVVLDFYLPDSNGLASIREIRKINASIPVVFLTALDDPQIEAQALQSGAAGYIQKDVVINLFMPTIQHSIAKK